MKLICGIDEAGRGALFGPVVVAACVLNENTKIEGLRDSKALTPARRLTLFHRIISLADDYYWIMIGPKRIDCSNILNACLFGFHRCVEKLKADLYIVDGPHLPKNSHSEVIAVPKADSIYEPVMAASILAKVIRDTLMSQLDAKYTSFGIAKNKGYGTNAHVQAIKAIGLSNLHRLSFCKFGEQVARKTRNKAELVESEAPQENIFLQKDLFNIL